MLMKVLYYAPLSKARFKGGIGVIAEYIKQNNIPFKQSNIKINLFNSSLVERNNSSMGKIRLANLRNYYIVQRALIEKIKIIDPDLVHINTSVRLALFKDVIIIRNIRKIFKGQIVIHIRYAELKKILFPYRILNNIVLKIMQNDIDKIIVLSKVLKRELIDAGIKESKIYVLYNFAEFKKPDIQNDLRKPQYNRKINLLFLGSLNRRKGIIDLLKALSLMNKERYLLNVAGQYTDNKVENHVTDIIKKHQFENNVMFHGYIRGNNKINLLQRSDILVLPSYGEGLPVAILEAMLAGCAIISTKVGAIPEIINEGENGYLIAPGDINSLYNYINYLFNNEEILEKMKQNNIETAAKDFTYEKYCKNLIRIYLDLLRSEL
jgi:glycosyltransferase involved in cell wall biosynthesis